MTFLRPLSSDDSIPIFKVNIRRQGRTSWGDLVRTLKKGDVEDSVKSYSSEFASPGKQATPDEQVGGFPSGLGRIEDENENEDD